MESQNQMLMFSACLAKGMGFTEPAFEDTEAEMITQALDNPATLI